MDVTGTVALWGASDLDDIGAQLAPRVTELELRRRLPGWAVRWFAPFGWEGRCAGDGGLLAEPLGDRTPERAAQLAAAADLVVINGPIGDMANLSTRVAGDSARDVAARVRWLAEPPGPAVWNAVSLDEPTVVPATGGYAAVRDERSRALAIGDVTVVPDVSVLADRLVQPEVLRARVAFMTFMGWWPARRPALVVHADASAAPEARELAAILEWAAADLLRADIVLLEATPCRGDAEVADELATRIRAVDVYRLPSPLPVEDVLAAAHGAALVITTAVPVAAAAAAHDVPWALAALDPATADVAATAALGAGGRHALDLGGLVAAIRAATTGIVVDGSPEAPRRRAGGTARSSIAPADGCLAAARATLDRHFDAIAAAADEAWQANGGSAAHRWAAVSRENEALRHAYRVMRERQAHERTALTRRSAVVHEIDRLRAQVAELEADRAELHALRDTKLLRWAQPARRVYGRLTGRSV